ncbi:peptidylprolyl isomerase [Pelistega sp. MC2]|uniref:peptidylprolyl isomerase n=1 Tax=Pelistega sp. MC2 TaxID=1720297 RepID=UPI0008DA4822|nr:peptidylprolyl isomerase [Pelistega sp. MC2]
MTLSIKPLIIAIALGASFPAMAQDAAIVNGKTITQAEVNATAEAMGMKDADAETKKKVLENLITQTALEQEAEKLGVDKDKDFQMALENARANLLISALVKQWEEKNPVKDADVKAKYDELSVKVGSRQEYNVRHILVKDEATAKKLIADIKAKKISFADAAKKSSEDKGSGAEGGELGWAPASRYVPEFAKAVEAGKKGELIAEPVKSEFGYHVIEVVDTRPIKAPAFEEVKAQLTDQVRQEAMLKYAKEIRDKAKVEIK